VYEAVALAHRGSTGIASQENFQNLINEKLETNEYKTVSCSCSIIVVRVVMFRQKYTRSLLSASQWFTGLLSVTRWHFAARRLTVIQQAVSTGATANRCPPNSMRSTPMTVYYSTTKVGFFFLSLWAQAAD